MFEYALFVVRCGGKGAPNLTEPQAQVTQLTQRTGIQQTGAQIYVYGWLKNRQCSLAWRFSLQFPVRWISDPGDSSVRDHVPSSSRLLSRTPLS